MKRREFIRNTGFTLGAAFLAEKRMFENAFRANHAGKRPNIVLIITDQQSADALSCRMGNKYLNTPNMDNLASNGTFFTNTYSANPLCVPARTSIFTGLYPHSTKVETNQDISVSQAGKNKCMGTIFKEHGYDTGFVGKWHMAFPPKDIESHGFDFMKSIKNNGIDKEVPVSAAEFLKVKREKPFLLVTSFVNPHNICEWPRGEALPDGEVGIPPSIDLCPPLKENYFPMKGEPEIGTLMRKSFQSNDMFPVGNFDGKKWREYRWTYFRLIEKVDALIGNVIQSLKDSGQHDNTVIVFTSDHGDMQGAHMWSQKTVFFEESSRVPFIIIRPGVHKARTADRLVNTGIDILPTLCDYAGIPIPQNLPGLSLKSDANGIDSKDVREYIVSENKMIQGMPIDGYKPEPNGRMVRSKQYKYCVYDLGKQSESLVDLQQDPGEMVNLALKPEYTDILNQHRAYLAEWCKKTNDTFTPSRQ